MPDPSSPLRSPWDANAWESDSGRSFWRKADAANKGAAKTAPGKIPEASKSNSARPKKELLPPFPDRQTEK